MIMAMEDLSKTQLVLLCLLVSFVASIGTGIITVSLLQEAPQGVSQTIYQVVERTVEKVAPQASNNSGKQTTETTVVVKEEDSVIDAIQKNNRSLVRIYQTQPLGLDQNQQTQPSLISLGVVIASDGTILTDKQVIAPDRSYEAVFADGKQFPVKILSTDDRSGAVYLQTLSGAGYAFFPAVIGNSDTVQLGQTVIALGGTVSNKVSVGRASTVGLDTSTSTRRVVGIETDSPLEDGIAGTLLLNLSGQLVGVKDWQPNALNEGRFVPINVFKATAGKFFGVPQNNNP